MKGIIKRFRIDSRIRIGYGTAFFLLLISYLVTQYGNRELLEQTKRVDQSNKMIINLENLISGMKDAETGFRGYVIMKDESYLAPFNEGVKAVSETFRALLSQTSDNKSQAATLQQVKKLAEERFAILNGGIKYYKNVNFEPNDSLKNFIYRGKTIMDRLRNLVKGMQVQENYMLDRRSEELAIRSSFLYKITGVSLGLALLLFSLGFITYIRENKARRKADQKVSEYQEELEERIKELDKANKELIWMRSLEKFSSTGRIARTIAHEVRNPLTNINLAVDELKSEQEGNGECKTLLLDLISRNGERINHLITQLLDSTKFTELKYEKVSINALLDEALEQAKDRLSLNKVKVVKSYSSDICDVSVDTEKIKIAFLNLIVNAIEAMEPEKGILKLYSKGENNKCIVEVSDNGSGMDAESMSKLFEPYFTSKTNGTGLGLTHTQNIILNHKGNISVESKVGKGTTFTITLDFAD